MADSIRGDGLFSAHRALLALEEDPLRLERARVRFDDSPPPYTSNPSGTTTRTESPVPLDEIERRRRRDQLAEGHFASRCRAEFERQISEETDRIIKACADRTEYVPVGVEFDLLAYEKVRKQWSEQGIWNDKWGRYTVGRWKHEEPLEVGSMSETDSDAPPPPLFGLRVKPRRLKSEDKRRRETETRRRDRESSRPYHQFVYQMSKEREQIQKEVAGGEESYTDDVNTQAYNNVLARWRKRRIWNEQWGIMPGMSWRHEKDWEEVLAEAGLQSTVVQTQAPAPPSETGQRPLLFTSLTNHAQDNEASLLETGQHPSLFPFSFMDRAQDDEVSTLEARSNQSRAFKTMYGRPQDIGLFSSRPQEDELATSMPNDATTSSQHSYDERVLSTASIASHESGAVTEPKRDRTREIYANRTNSGDAGHSNPAFDLVMATPAAAIKRPRKTKKRELSEQDQQPQLASSTSSRALRSSRISKAVTTATRKKGSQSTQRSHVCQEALHNDIKPPLNRDSLDRKPRRRSTRLEKSEVGPHDGVLEVAAKTRSKRTTASGARSQSSAKPQGISKKRNTTKTAHKRKRRDAVK